MLYVILREWAWSSGTSALRGWTSSQQALQGNVWACGMVGAGWKESETSQLNCSFGYALDPPHPACISPYHILQTYLHLPYYFQIIPQK
eukprot:1141451-Pelagomonas_calceolata.AAC.3